MMQNYFRRSIMFLYFNGCSYTQGKGCEDRVQQRFSTIVSNHLGADHYNDAKSGSSNDGIVYRTYEWMNKNTCDHAIILMTHSARMDLNSRLIPGPLLYQDDDERNTKLFYDNFYDDNVGAINFYKNRLLLEQLFERKGIPLLLLQYLPVQGEDDNPFKKMCNGDLPLVSKSVWNLSSKKTILGISKNKKYYWSEKEKKGIGHFNYKGHEKLADWIIDKLTSTI